MVGLGFGLAFMASQGFIIAYTDKNTKAHGFAILFAALFAGGFCGSSTGAMLAERIGYRPVFMLGGLIIFSTILYTLLFMKDAIKKPAAATSEAPAPAPTPALNIKEILRYLCRRNVITVILFSSIPANMAMIGFLNYFNPVYLNRIGVSQSNIGRTFMIYCALAIYIGPWISRYIDASENKKAYMIFGGILGALAFIVFHFFHGLTASVVAIILLGLCNSFVFVSQAAYLLKLKSTHDVGQGKAIAAYRLANRLGQVIGPITFGWLIVATDIKMGMTYVGLFYLFLTVLFFLFAQSDSEIAAVKSSPAEIKEQIPSETSKKDMGAISVTYTSAKESSPVSNN